MNSDAEVVSTLQAYYVDFNTFGLPAIVRYFHEPCLLMAPHGIFSAATHDDLAPVIKSLIDSLRARGFSRSELQVARVDSLGARASIVTAVAIRHAVAGGELERVGLSYVMHKTEASWKIAVLLTHGE